jgi:ECF transporter S component (folate family)
MKKTIDKPTRSKFFSPKRLSLMAMLIALQIVLSKFLMLQLTDSIRLSIDSVPILLAGIWFGPIAGGIVGALADLLGTVLFPTAGAYFPLLTVAFFLIGVVSGLLSFAVKNRPAALRAIVCVIPAELIGSFLFKSFALSTLFGIPFSRHAHRTRASRFRGSRRQHADCRTARPVIGSQAKSADFLKKSAPVQDTLPQGTMNYEQALTYIHQVAWRGSRLGLERTNELLERIGNPIAR